MRVIDKYVFGLFILIFFPLKYIFLWKRKKIMHSPKKILVIRMRALWSSLLTFPMIKQLQDHYGKNVQYDLLASSRNIWVFTRQWYFKHQYNIFKIKDLLKLLISFKKYDIVIDAEEYFHLSSMISLRVGKITVGYANLPLRKLAYVFSHYYAEKTHNIMNCLSLLTPLGIKIYPPKAMEPLIYDQKHTIKVDKFFQQFTGKKFVCLHTWWAETSPERFRADYNWIELIEKLNQSFWNKIVIFLSGTEFEEQWVKKIMNEIDAKTHNVFSLCGMFSLFEFAYLLKKCDLMISNDTGPMHLSTCMWTKTIGLFGPNLPERFGPWPLDNNTWLYKWNGEIDVLPEFGVFKKDVSGDINKIHVDDVMAEIHLLKSLS